MHRYHVFMICACSLLTGCSVSIEPAAVNGQTQTTASADPGCVQTESAYAAPVSTGTAPSSPTVLTAILTRTNRRTSDTSAATETTTSTTAVTTTVSAKQDSGTEWMLRLVNKTHPIGQYVPPELVTLRNNTQVDARMYPYLQEMYDDMRMDGLKPITREAYRTYAQQEDIMQTRISKHKSEGHSDAEAKRLAEMYVAVPGASEHQLGLAVDVNSEDGNNQPVYDWLQKNAYKYGFIQRYPADKSEITGYEAEAWHYRYVGTDAAKVIYETGITLEEYLGAA